MDNQLENIAKLRANHRGSLVEGVFQALKDGILEGKLSEGYALPPHDALGEMFGVSRTVVREALKQLSSLGLVKSIQGKGTFVSTPDTKSIVKPMLQAFRLDETSINHLLETRFFLERAVARLAALRADETSLAALQERIDLMEHNCKLGQYEQHAINDLAFHLELAKTAGNPVLEQLLEAVRETMWAFFKNASFIPGMAKAATASHRRIFETLVLHDSDAAARAMSDHLHEVVVVLRKKSGMSISLPFGNDMT